MKICILTHTFPRFPGDSVAPFMSNLAGALARVGHEVDVLIPFDPKFKRELHKRYKIKFYKYIFPDSFHSLGYSRTLKGDRGLKTEAYLLSPLLFFFGFLELLRLVKKNKIDIVSAHWIIPNGFIAALVSKLTGVPFVVTIPGSDVYLGGKNRLFRLMIEFASKQAKVVLADNRIYISQLHDLGIYPKKTFIIPYGVNTEKFKPFKKDNMIIKKLGINEISPIILAVGRLVFKKGFLYLIRAMPLVLKIHEQAKLVIVGDGDQKEELLSEVRKLNINKSVIFAGTVSYDVLSQYYNIGDVFVMPSIKDETGNIDASPVAMMEAMAFGTPIVATNHAVNGNLLEAGKTGYIVKEKNSKDISNAISTLLNKKNQKIMRREVRRKAIENFSISSVAQKYTKVLNLAIEAK